MYIVFNIKPIYPECSLKVSQLHKLLNPTGFSNRAVAIYLDAWGIKRLSSLAMRRWRSPIGALRDSQYAN